MIPNSGTRIKRDDFIVIALTLQSARLPVASRKRTFRKKGIIDPSILVACKCNVNLAIGALLPSFGAREKWLSRVGRHWRDGSNGSALLLALDLRELPVLDQEIKTRAACVGLFVGPFDHVEFAIDEEFLALLNELAAILGGSSQYLEVDKSGDLLFLPLSVREVLVVGDGCRKLLPGAILHFW